MPQIPEYLEHCRETRLIPVGSSSNTENQVLSAFLSTLPVIQGWFNAAFAGGPSIKLGKQAKMKCFTEVVFKDKEFKDCRPDGLILITTGKTHWSALIEAKVKNNKLDAAQVEKYCRAAKQHKIDAVITLSNELTSKPDHHFLDLPKHLTKAVDLYHFSWASILTTGQVLLGRQGVDDVEQIFILEELVKYFQHDSAGISRFSQMSASWLPIVKQATLGQAITKNTPDLDDLLNDWLQESKDLVLTLSNLIHERAELRLSKGAKDDVSVHQRDIAQRLFDSASLTASLDVPNCASSIDVDVFLKTRQVQVSMRLQAPRDKKSTSARVNWLLRMLKEVDMDGYFVTATWPTVIKDTTASVIDLRNDQTCIQCDNPKMAPINLIVKFVIDDARAFSGRKTFVQTLGVGLEKFYTDVGQHLKAWQPSPPRAKKVEPELEEGVLEG